MRALYDPETEKRGFQGKTKEKNEGKEMGKDEITKFLKSLVESNHDDGNTSIYEEWEKIRELYRDKGIKWYTYGNAQKWVNMAIKYFIVILICKGMPINDSIIDDALFPVDRIMIKEIKKDFEDISFNGNSWSRCDDKQQFIDYISKVKYEVKNKYDLSLFEYELLHWDN